MRGGKAAKEARLAVEQQTGKPVIAGQDKAQPHTVVTELIAGPDAELVSHTAESEVSDQENDRRLSLPYKMEIVPDMDEGGFIVSYPDLPGCLSSGETLEQAIANAEDAKKAWLEAAGK